MLSFQLDALCATDIGGLDAGDLFFLGGRAELVLGVVLPRIGKDLRVVTLTGADAFKIKVEKPKGREVVPLKIERSRMRVRFDVGAAEAQAERHQLGQLVICQGVGVGICVTYSDLDPDAYRHVVMLKDWDVDVIGRHVLAVGTWSLSYIDEAGLAVDLFTRVA